jgi:DNA-binding response OmpR family regulator
MTAPADADAERMAVHVLIVEDEFLIAALLEEDLHAAGCTTLGPFSSLAAALKASASEDFDLAILDVNLGGEMVYPLADALSRRGVPILFLSGYDVSSMPERFRTSPRLAKPYDRAALHRHIRRVGARVGAGVQGGGP